MPVNFLQPQFAWALAGLAIPVVVHLLARWRNRQVDLGTLRFLRIAISEDSRHRRLKRWFLLALRLGCVALLACLFARQFLSARNHAGQRKLVVILIDRSASMELKDRGQRLVDLAVDAARDVLRQMDKETDVEIAFFYQAVYPVRNADVGANDRRISPAKLADLIQSPGELRTATNYGAALTWARDEFVHHPQAWKELYIYTDLQRSGLDWTDAGPLPADVRLHLVDLGRLSVHNVAVVAAQPARTVVRPGESVTIQARVFNAGAFSVGKMPVILTLDHGSLRHVLRELISPASETTASVEFQVPALSEGLWQGTVRIETDDDLSFDNQRYVGILCLPKTQVLIVDGGVRDNTQLSEAYFLDKSLALSVSGESFADSSFLSRSVSLLDGESLPDLKAQQIVVLANLQELSSADAASLAMFVSGGGSLLVFCGEQVHADGYRAAAQFGLCVGEIGSVLRVRELPHRLERWDEAHPLFEPFLDPQHGDLRRWTFRACTHIVPDSDARVIAWFRGHVPALIEKKLGSGKVLWFTSSCGREWSEWPHSRLYLPFMHQTLSYLAGLAGGGQRRERFFASVYKAMTSYAFTHVALQKAKEPWISGDFAATKRTTTGMNVAEHLKKDVVIVQNLTPKNSSRIVITHYCNICYRISFTALGGGPVRNRLMDSSAALDAHQEPGVFKRDGSTEVVNLGPRESETDRCTPEEFSRRFQLTQDQINEIAKNSTPTAASMITFEARDDEIWPRVALLFLAFLLIEGFVANRTTA